ncbi:MAG: DNA-processing protein DprA, partial [Candidatus Omnitrophota bacterium]
MNSIIRDLIKDPKELSEEIDYLESEKIKTVSPEDKEYPGALRNIYRPPALLFYKGTLLSADADAVAIVGSRRCSEYGLRTAGKIAFELAERGVTV